MELDELKSIWKGQVETPVGDEEKYRVMINMRSNSPVARMQRNLLFEMLIVILLYGAVVLYYFIAFKGVWQIIGWAYLGMMLLHLAYFYRKYKLLAKMQCLTCQVKSNLRRLVTSLEKYVHFYMISGTILVFLVFWFLWIMLALNMPQLGNKSIFFPSAGRSIWEAGAYWFPVTLLMAGLMHYLNKWQLYKLYGRHIRKLQELLNQMEDSEN